MRQIGTFEQPFNYEVTIEGMLDARMLVPTFADLLTFTELNYLPNGFLVSVYDPDPANRGVYRLVDNTALDTMDSWVKLAETGSVTANNGLNMDNGPVQLGGDLLGYTNINMPIETGLNFVTPDTNALMQFSNGGLDQGRFTVQIVDPNTNLGGATEITSTVANFNFNDITLNKTTGIHIEPTLFQLVDQTRLKGVTYADNYFAVGSLDDRWIPDWGAVKGAFVNLTTNQVDIAGNKTWIGNHTYHVTGSNSTTFLSQEGWGITNTVNTNFYTTNPFDGFVAGSPTQNIGIVPYRISFNKIVGGETAGTLNVFGPDNLNTSQTVKFQDNKGGLIAYLSDVPDVTAIQEELDSKLDKLNYNLDTNLYTANLSTISSDFTNPGGWVTTTGGITPVATGIANYIMLNKEYAIEKRYVEHRVTWAANTQLLISTRNITALTEYGTAALFDATNSVINLYTAYDNTVGTLPAVKVTTAYTFVTGRDYIIRLRIDTFTNTVTIIDTITNIITSISDGSRDSGRGYDAYALAVLGGSFPIVKSFNVNTPYPKGLENGFMGDSIATMYYINQSGVYGGTLLPEDYKLRHAQKIVDRWNGQAFISGRGGDNIDGIIRRIATEVIPLKPKGVTIMIGTNSGNDLTKLATMVTTLQGAGIEVALCKIPPRSDFDISSRNTDIQTTADLYGCKVIDFYTPMTLNQDGSTFNPALYFVEPVTGAMLHPNKDGAEIMYEATLATSNYYTRSNGVAYGNQLHIGDKAHSAFATSNTFTTADAIVHERFITGSGQGSPAGMLAIRHRGTVAAPLRVMADDYIAALTGRGGYDSTNAFSTGRGELGIYAAEDFDSTHQGTYLKFVTTTKGGISTFQSTYIMDDGRLIGGAGNAPSLADTTYKLQYPSAKFNGATQFAVAVDRAVGSPIGYTYNRAGLQRWWLGMGSGAESGSNAGSDFAMAAYDDTGTVLGNVITIVRSTQIATFVKPPRISTLTASRPLFLDASNNVTTNAITGTGNVVMSASPTLTGTPLAPTPASNVNTTQIVTGAWVNTYFGALAAANSWSAANTFGLEVTGNSGFITKSNNPVQFYGTGNTFFGNLFPDVLTGNQNWNLPNSSGTLALVGDITARTIYNSTTTALSLATLNSTYSTATLGQMIVCSAITGGGLIYIKANSTNWVTIQAPLTT